MRRPFIAGNWKMNMLSSQAADLMRTLDHGFSGEDDVDIAVFPPAIYLRDAVKLLSNSTIQVGAQNVCWERNGAFTGEISPAMLKDMGVHLAIIGHSERRTIFLEDDAMINRKLRHALDEGLMPVLCIGETLSERNAGKTEAVIERQISKAFTDVPRDRIPRVTVAYEPVWAIGTGKTATPEQAQQVHRVIREWLGTVCGEGKAATIRILYGGSVKPENARELLHQPDIDGALVGGASLKADSFLAIAEAALY
ncbi:triose-phosphate isomerase [bacterium]|nr:triose-phosphate isomerase [bacterium]